MRVLTSPNTPIPEVQLLSNGRYHVMVTNAGGGSSRWKDLAVTRWREDSTSDNWGTFCYLRDEASGEFWSTAYQPTLKLGGTLRGDFLGGPGGVSPQRFRFRDAYRDRGFARRRYRGPPGPHHQPVPDSPGQSTSRATRRWFSRRRPRTHCIRRSAISSCRPRSSKHSTTILCTRRPRSLEEQVPWMFHLMTVHGADAREISFETDRMRFIGRGGSVAAPLAMTESRPAVEHRRLGTWIR